MAAALPPGHVHLWRLSGRQPGIERMRADAARLLSPEERRRLDGMQHPKVADRFVLGRLLLRSVLGRYLGAEAAGLEFRYNANGKPGLAEPVGDRIGFNLSHSASEFVLAVCREAAIGVDLEALDRAPAAQRIARRFFAADEVRQLAQPGCDADARALLLWSLKESIVKAKGETVWDGLAAIPLAIEGRRIIPPPADRAAPAGWRLAAGPLGDSHVLAVALAPADREQRAATIYRTYRLGSDAIDPDAFEPQFRT